MCATTSYWRDPSCEADYWSSQLLRGKRIESTVWINPLLSGPRRKFVFDQWYDEISHQKFGFKQTATTGYFDGDFYLSCLSISFFSSSTN